MHPKAEYYIQKLPLEAHPEGGYFKETYRSDETINAENLPGRYKGNRCFSTLIYFLLHGEQVSMFHKLKSDEGWHFYDGSAVIIYVLDENGHYSEVKLGRNLDRGEQLQYVIKKNSWFAAELEDKSSFVLVGCSVAPGFDFNDFKLGDPDELIEKYPDKRSLVERIHKK